jgi:hypothetical protein
MTGGLLYNVAATPYPHGRAGGGHLAVSEWTMIKQGIWSALACAGAALLAGTPALTLGGTIASARQPPATDGPLTTAAPERPPPPPSPDVLAARAKRALAQQVYDLIGPETLSPTTRALAASLSVQVARAVSNKDIARAKAIMAAVNDGLDDIMPSISDATVTLMTEDFTQEQLQALLDFYQSPAGQAALKILPRIASQASTLSMRMTPQMMTTIRDSYCGRVKCTSQERSAFTAIAERAAAAEATATKAPAAGAPPRSDAPPP